MKYLLALLVLVMVSCSQIADINIPKENLTADFVITSVDWEYGYLDIYYTITNTCPVTIDYYEVIFLVETNLGDFQVWTNGLTVKPGLTALGWTIEYFGVDTIITNIYIHSAALWSWDY